MKFLSTWNLADPKSVGRTLRTIQSGPQKSWPKWVTDKISNLREIYNSSKFAASWNCLLVQNERSGAGSL